MDRWNRIKPILHRTINAITLMVVGAWLLVQYLEISDPTFGLRWDWLEQQLFVAFISAAVLASFVGPKKPIDLDTNRLAPRWSGVSVVALTGMAAVCFLLLEQGDESSYALPLAVALVTVGITVAVWRFATANAADIGEASFKP